MMTEGAHPSDGVLRAWADGELSVPHRMATAVHLLRCGRCRAALEAIRAGGRATHGLLALLDKPVETEEGWRRLAARLGASSRAAPQSQAPVSTWLAWALAAMFAIVALTLAVDRVRDPSPAIASAGGRQDICCWDLDGGGRSDDGVMTLSSEGELLDCVVLYDDLDRSRSFTGGDAVRYVSRPESCAPLAGIEDGQVQLAQLIMDVGDLRGGR